MQTLLFVGFKSFKGKDNKEYNVLTFLSEPVTKDRNLYCKEINIFVNQNVFNEFIEQNKILSLVEVEYKVVADKVIYSI